MSGSETIVTDQEIQAAANECVHTALKSDSPTVEVFKYIAALVEGRGWSDAEAIRVGAAAIDCLRASTARRSGQYAPEIRRSEQKVPTSNGADPEVQPVAVLIAPDCQWLMEEFRIEERLVIDAVNYRDSAMADRARTILCGIHWLDEIQLLFFCGRITGKSAEVDSIQIHEVTVDLALKLIKELPAGSFNRSTNIETVLALIAESFGTPVRCHSGEPFSTLYSGPAVFDPEDPRLPFVDMLPEAADLGPIRILGNFRPAKGFAQYAWALVINRYRRWLQSLGLTGAPRPR